MAWRPQIPVKPASSSLSHMARSPRSLNGKFSGTGIGLVEMYKFEIRRPLSPRLFATPSRFWENCFLFAEEISERFT
jgi:hypothetical protein